MREAGAEFVALSANRLVADDHAALEQQLLDIARAELKAKIPTHGVADDRRQESMTVIRRFRLLHRIILTDSLANVTVPSQPQPSFGCPRLTPGFRSVDQQM